MRPLQIILCKEADREEMARRFYRLKSFEVIEETYQRQVKGLEAMQPATPITMGKLQQERDQAKANAEKAAEGLAKEGLGQRSPLCRQARGCFWMDESTTLLSFWMKTSYDERRKKEKGKSPMPSRPGCSRAASLH